MEKKREVMLAVVLVALIQASVSLEIQPSSNPAVAGDNLTLSLSPPVNLTAGSWAVGSSQILNWVGDQVGDFASHRGRASVDVVSGVLTLRSITVADSGVYVMQSNNPTLRANISISVFESISNVRLEVNESTVVEFNGLLVMKCSVSSGSSLSFLWLNGSSEATASARAQLTDGNSTLTIVNITRYDRGPFTCSAFNPVSNGTSDPQNFNITYGPDHMALTVNGSLTVGNNLTMTCTAQSNPPARLHWAFRGEPANTTGPLLELYRITEDQSGPYSCLGFNNHTNMNSSITTHIKIVSAGCKQQAAMMWRVPVLLVLGFLLSCPGGSGSIHG